MAIRVSEASEAASSNPHDTACRPACALGHEIVVTIDEGSRDVYRRCQYMSFAPTSSRAIPHIPHVRSNVDVQRASARA